MMWTWFCLPQEMLWRLGSLLNTILDIKLLMLCWLFSSVTLCLFRHILDVIKVLTGQMDPCMPRGENIQGLLQSNNENKVSREDSPYVNLNYRRQNQIYKNFLPSCNMAANLTICYGNPLFYYFTIVFFYPL